VREKQVERLPISRGEVLLHDLAARYPNLENDILKEHEARRFTANLGTSLASSFGRTSVSSTSIIKAVYREKGEKKCYTHRK
jgi:hypothetical protein